MHTQPTDADPESSAPVRSGGGFTRGLTASLRSAFTYSGFATCLGFGALCHDLGFGLLWACLATVVVYAGPAQTILVTMLWAGAPWLQVAVAVGLSGIRLFPMTVSLLPTLRTPQTRLAHLLLPAHFVAVSFWIEMQRLAPAEPRASRIAFGNGLGAGFTVSGTLGTAVGFYLAAGLPPLLAAALLFLTPLTFLLTTAGNSVQVSDRVAFGVGLVVAPVLVWLDVGLALLLAALVAGSVGYGAHWLRRRAS